MAKRSKVRYGKKAQGYALNVEAVFCHESNLFDRLVAVHMGPADLADAKRMYLFRFQLTLSAVSLRASARGGMDFGDHWCWASDRWVPKPVSFGTEISAIEQEIGSVSCGGMVSGKRSEPVLVMCSEVSLGMESWPKFDNKFRSSKESIIVVVMGRYSPLRNLNCASVLCVLCTSGPRAFALE